MRLALFLVLVSLGIRALVSEPTLTFALDELAQRLHEELGLTLVVAHVEADAETARVEMGPVVLKGTDGEVLFSADKIRAELAPLKFFEKRLRLEHLVIESPRVNLRIVDGKIAGIVPPADASTSDDPLLKVDVADFQLHDGAVFVVVTDSKKPEGKQQIVKSNLSGIEMRLRDRGREEHRLKFTVQQADIARPIDLGDAGGTGEDIITVDAFSGRITVKGDGLLAPEKITVSDVTLVADDAEINIAGDVVLGPAGLVPAFDADISMRAELASVLTHLQLGMPITGGATLTAHVSAQPGGEQLVAVGQVETRDVHVDNLRMGSLRARIKATPTQIDIEQAAWDWADTTIKGTATVQLDDKMHTTVKASADAFSIWKLMYGMGVDGAWGDAKVDGLVDVSGTLKPLLLEGKGGGTFTDVVVASMDVRKALKEHPDRIVIRTASPILAPDVTMRVNEEGLKFEGAIDDGFTRASGVFQVYYDVNKGLFIDAESDQADFATVGGKIGDLMFTGVGRGHMHVEGPQSGPVLTAELELNGFGLEDFAFGDATGRVHLFRDDLRFEDVVAVKNGRTKYGGLVALSFAEPAARSELEKADATIETPHLTVDVGFGANEGQAALAQDLRAVVPAKYTDGVLGFLREDFDLTGPVRGRVTARGAVGDGTFDHVEMEGRVDLLEGAAILDQHVSGDGAFHMSVDRFYIDSLDVTLGSQDKRTVAEARGSAHAVADVGRHDADLSGSFSVHGLQLADIDELKGTSKPFKGALDFDGRLLGQARNPGIKGHAAVRGAAFGSVPIGDADVDVTHDNRLLTLVGKALSGRGDATVHVATRSPFTYDAQVAVNEGQLAPLLPADVLPSSVSALLAGDVEVRGALKTFRDSRGALTLNKLAVKAGGLELSSVGEASAHFHGTRLTFDLLDLATKERDTVSLRGLLSDDEIDLQLSGHADLKMLPSLWTKATSADGKLTFDLAVTGDLDHASMSGQGFIAGGKLALDGPFPPLEDLDAQISFRGPNIVIERATAKAGGATIQGQGAVTMDGVDPLAYDLELRYQRMKLKAPANIESLSSGRLQLKGEAALPTLTGEVRVHSARYSEDINWERLLPDLRRRTGALESLDTDDEDVRFDVHLIADRGIVVENNVLDLEAKGDLFLTGTEERPGLKGGVQLIRGNATFRGNRYRLAAGTVDFVDTYRVMPVLDIEAETRVQDYDVTAHLTGPAQAPVIDLSARPDLSEIDIVSLLTFGFTQYEVRDAGGSAGAAGLEVVSAYTGLDKELRRVLPEAVRKSSALSLDELRLTSQFSARAGASVPAVAVGMEVNPGLWGVDGSRLRLQSTLLDTTGSGTQQRVEWEKRFENNVRLRVVWDSEDDGTCPSCTNQWGDLGGDLWYRWEF